jgi:hypothetical protein
MPSSEMRRVPSPVASEDSTAIRPARSPETAVIASTAFCSSSRT